MVMVNSLAQEISDLRNAALLSATPNRR